MPLLLPRIRFCTLCGCLTESIRRVAIRYEEWTPGRVLDYYIKHGTSDEGCAIDDVVRGLGSSRDRVKDAVDFLSFHGYLKSTGERLVEKGHSRDHIRHFGHVPSIERLVEGACVLRPLTAPQAAPRRPHAALPAPRSGDLRVKNPIYMLSLGGLELGGGRAGARD